MEEPQAMKTSQSNDAPHPCTTALTLAAERLQGLPPHVRARLAWMAWIRYSSRSAVKVAGSGGHMPNFYTLLIG